MGEYDKDLMIDKYSLDEELVDQPSLFMKYSELYVEAVVKRDRLKSRLEITYAEIYKDMKSNPNDYDLGNKPTDTSIKVLIPDDGRYRKVQQEVTEAIRQTLIYGSAVEAMQHKKRSLSKLVELYLAGYYSAVKLSKNKKEDIDETIKERQKERQKKLKKQLKLKK